MDYSQMRTFDNHGSHGKLIITANKMGFMSINLPDEYVQAFVDYSATADGPVADLGCAYGHTAKLMLNAGAKSVLANDIYPEHLAVFKQSLNDQELQCTTLIAGDATELCRTMESGSMAGILAANWLHFLTGENIRKTFAVFYRSLKPGGRLVVTTVSSRHGLHRHATPEIEQRTEAGDEWPGWIEGGRVDTLSADLPEFCMFLDPPQLVREAKLAGFVVKKASFFARDLYPESCQLDGQEASGLIAEKPFDE